MLHDYPDIRKRIPEEPKWYDANGVPRYDEFTPELCPDIYATAVVLLRIACQECGREFLVEMHTGPMDYPFDNTKELHYGDPPRHDGACVSGNTMNCEDLEVVQVWRRDLCHDWKRCADEEGLIPNTAE